ncbi:MAG: phosphoadenylyl-sulfate reductase [Pseudolabrys sp.]
MHTVDTQSLGNTRDAPGIGGDAADLSSIAKTLNESLTTCDPIARLRGLRDAVAGRLVFTTSFGLEDQVVTHVLHQSGIDAEVVTLDTGRLFPETYDVWARTELRYGRKIAPFYPNHSAVEALVARQGINGFYNSVEARQACCRVRKVEPLERALSGAAGWITGLRADQSQQRGSVTLAEADDTRQLLKFNPLFDWTRDRALDLAKSANIPLNPLHAAGFASIGCAPCTRALETGEPERAGRWWWENEAKKECGLHLDHPARTNAAAEATGSR